MRNARARDWFLVLGIVVLAGCMGDTRPKIVIEWGVEPALEGSAVEVDGQPVGKLTKFGQATRTSFAVAKGDHLVRIVRPGTESEPVKVSTLLNAQRVMLLADFREASGSDGSMKMVLTLRM